MAMPIVRHSRATATSISRLVTTLIATHKSEHSPDLPSHRARVYEAAAWHRRDLLRAKQKQERDLSLRKSIGGIGIALGLLLTGVPLAFAQSADDKVRPDPLRAGADSWDANHDGVYTCDEWKKHLDRIFTLADRNHDGRLDAAEFATVKKADPALADADFGYFDENQDGKITREEFVSKPSEFILRFDKNGDCRVTQDEIKAGSTPAQVGPKQPTRDRFHTN
jgi:hypothetical protein